MSLASQKKTLMKRKLKLRLLRLGFRLKDIYDQGPKGQSWEAFEANTSIQGDYLCFSSGVRNSSLLFADPTNRDVGVGTYEAKNATRS